MLCALLITVSTPCAFGQAPRTPIDGGAWATPAGELLVQGIASEASRVVLDDGRPVRLEPVRLVADPPPRAWLPMPRWRPAGEGERAHWEALTALLPIDGVGQSLWIDGRRVRVRWLPPLLDARNGPDWRERARASPTFAAAIAPLARSPLESWRVAISGRDAFDRRTEDPGMATIASVLTHAWQAALARLEASDARLAREVRDALLVPVDFGNGRVLPVWATTSDDERRLLNDLLDETLTPKRLVARVRLFFENAPATIAWIIDADAAPGGGGSVLVGIANLTSRELAARTTPTLDPVTIDARSARGLRVHIAPGSGSRTPSGTGVVVDGRTVLDQQALRGALGAWGMTPPGLRMIPAPELDLFRWRGTGAFAPGCLAMLDQGPGPEEALRLFVEIGPAFGRAGGACTLVSGEARRTVEILPGQDRLVIDVPRAWFASGSADVGLELTSGDGVRWTWPRAVMPGQGRLPRGRIVVSGWDGVRTIPLPERFLSGAPEPAEDLGP